MERLGKKVIAVQAPHKQPGAVETVRAKAGNLSSALEQSWLRWEELAAMCCQLVGIVLSGDPAAAAGRGK